MQAQGTSTTGIATPQAWLRAANNTAGQPIVVEGYLSTLDGTGTPLTSAVLPDAGNMSIASVSATDYVNEALSPLPSCPLNFALFSTVTGVAPTTYQVCGQAVSSATSPAAPWSVAVSAVVTVAPFPTYSAITGQWSFPIQSITSGGYSQQLQTANSSSALVTSSSIGSSALYLQSNGAFSLDTTGVTLALQSSVALPSSSSTAHATNTLSVAGQVPTGQALQPGSLTAFTQLTSPWPARLIPGLAFVRDSFTYLDQTGATQTAPGGTSLLLYGGQNSTTLLYNDLWLSTDSGVTFTTIGGPLASQAQNAQYGSPLVGYDGSIKIQDVKGRLYAIAGSYKSVVQYSDNALNWTTVGVPFHGRAYTFATADPLGNIYVMGGQGRTDDHTGATGTYLNDVWMSSSQGVTWQLQTAAAAWDIRDSLMGVSFYSTQLQKVVIVHSGGHDDTTLNFRPNEVWGSSDQGVTWTLFPRAPYVGRNHASMQLASNGVMVVVAGKTDVVTPLAGGGTDTNTGFNDIWVSVTGGTSWSLCTAMANFRPRQDLAATIDSAGYLYVSSGIDGLLPGSTTIADLWKSPISFLNLQAVSQACGVQIPACGVGLRCWPTPGKAYNCPCDFQVKGADTPSQSQLTLTPLYSPFSTSTSAQSLPTCSPLPLPAAPTTSPFLIQSWTFCYQTYSAATANGVTGPYSTVYSGQITTAANATYSPVTGQLGYSIVAISGYRTQLSASGVLSSSAITGFSVLALPITTGTQTTQQSDPYLYVASGAYQDQRHVCAAVEQRYRAHSGPGTHTGQRSAGAGHQHDGHRHTSGVVEGSEQHRRPADRGRRLPVDAGWHWHAAH